MTDLLIKNSNELFKEGKSTLQVVYTLNLN